MINYSNFKNPKTFYFLALGLVFSLFFSSNLSAQHQCGVTPEAEAAGIPSIMENMEDWQRFKSEFSTTLFDRSADYIPVKIHIIRRSNKTGGISKEAVNEGIALVNSIFIEANIQLEVCGAINYINSNKYYAFSEDEEDDLVADHYVSGVLNIYYTGSVGPWCGYAKFPWDEDGRDFLIMPNSCAMNESTFPHEVGHYFGLWHTHTTTNGAELVTRGEGKNCETAGDLLCDTPADPRLSGKVNSECEYTGSNTDANNQSYAPDPHNLMSYSLKPCRDYFSPEQIARIRFYLNQDRQDLECNAEYCESEGTEGNTRWIEKVQFGSINNQSGNDGGYGKFIDVSTKLARGQAQTITFKHGKTGADFFSGWNVWIDLNQNYQFESNERLAILGYNTIYYQQYSVNITIPNTAKIGATRMRVAMGGTASACGEIVNGEVEDYTVYIEKPGDGYCTAQGNNSDNNYINSVAFAGINNVSGQNGGYGNYSNHKATVERGKTYNISFSQNQHFFHFDANHWKVWVDWNQDKKFNDDPTEFMGYHWTSYFEPSRTFGITIPANAKVGETKMRILMNGQLTNFEGCSHMTYGEVEDYTIRIEENYCAAKGQNANYEWIDKVIFQSVDENQNDATTMIENHSGKNNGYGNYKNVKVRMQQGLSYPVIIVPGFGNAKYPENYRIWVDLNKDGDYTDAGEMMFETENATKESVQAFLNIPPNSHIGETRMRIAQRWAGSSNLKPGVCDTYGYGEVEEYTIDILEMSVGVDEGLNVPTLFEIPEPLVTDDKLSPRELQMFMSPNPTQGNATVEMDLGFEQPVKIEVLNIMGQKMKTFRPEISDKLNYEMDLSDLNGGTYIIRVNGENFGISKKLILVRD